MPVSISKQTHTHVHTLTQGLDASEMMRMHLKMLFNIKKACFNGSFLHLKLKYIVWIFMWLLGCSVWCSGWHC